MNIKLDKDLVLDALGTAVIAYVSWILIFQQEGIPALDPFFAIIGTAAVGIIAWRFLRKR